jgi:aminoglycoside phosphotransferase (APT) family kinase protein
MTDEALIGLGKLIRDFHDAAVGLGDEPMTWDPLLGDPSGSTEVICHNDLSIPNAVFRSYHPVALVDWDFAAPGRRL